MSTPALTPELAAEMARVQPWRPLAAKYVARNPILKIEEPLAIVWNESTGNGMAVNPGDPSWGPMQIEAGIARIFGGVSTPPARGPEPWEPPLYGYDPNSIFFDPDFNMMCGCGFLAHLKICYAKKFPFTDPNCPWFVSYNEGEPNLVKHRPDPKYAQAFLLHVRLLGGTPE
jgi:hypothetical protein